MFVSKARATASISRLVSILKKQVLAEANSQGDGVVDVQTSLAMKLSALRAEEAILRESEGWLDRKNEESSVSIFNSRNRPVNHYGPGEEIVMRSYEFQSVPYVTRSA